MSIDFLTLLDLFPFLLFSSSFQWVKGFGTGTVSYNAAEGQSARSMDIEASYVSVVLAAILVRTNRKSLAFVFGCVQQKRPLTDK